MMRKIYTQIILQGYKKFILVIAFAVSVVMLQSYKEDSFFIGETGLLAKTIKCYPNPAVSFVNFEFPTDLISKDYSLKVYSFTGKQMFEINITSAKATLTFTNDFYRGIYVYQLHDKSGKIVETGKFQIVK